MPALDQSAIRQSIVAKLQSGALPLDPTIAGQLADAASKKISERRLVRQLKGKAAADAALKVVYGGSIKLIEDDLVQRLRSDIAAASLAATAELATAKQNFHPAYVASPSGKMNTLQQQAMITGMAEDSGETEFTEAVPSAFGGMGTMGTLAEQAAKLGSAPMPESRLAKMGGKMMDGGAEFGRDVVAKAGEIAEEINPLKKEETAEAAAEQPTRPLTDLEQIEQGVAARRANVTAKTPDDLLSRASNLVNPSGKDIKKKDYVPFKHFRDRKGLAKGLVKARGGQGGVAGYAEQIAYRIGLGKLEKLSHHLGQTLKHNIKTGKFSSFGIALVLALVKDIIDGAEFPEDGGSLIAPILSFLIGIVLVALLFGEGTYFRVKIIQRLAGVELTAFIAEYIPVINAFPWYTVSVLIMEYYALRSIARQKELLWKLTLQIKLIKHLQKGQPNERQMQSIEKQLKVIEKEAGR